MYLHKLKKPNGDIYLAIKEKFHVPKVGARERTVKSLGYVSALKEQYDDPIAHFTQVARDMTLQKKKETLMTFQIDISEKMELDTDELRNLGYGVFKELYRLLELDKFWSWKTRNMRTEYSADQIFRLLVFSRILTPASKKKTYEQRKFFFEEFDGFSLDDVYHALDVICENSEALQKWIYEHSGKICERDLSTAYFDCTNYYFDIGRSDMDDLNDEGNPVDADGNIVAAKYRKRGPEKNHRPDPIVGMGLLMDRSGIPLAFDMFPGNESEKLHMRPIINRVKNEFTDSRIIFVADRGLNTSDNIYYLNGDNRGENNQRDGYVYGQSVRGADAEFKAWVLSGDYQHDTIADDNGNEISFIHKSRIYPKELKVNVTKPGQTKPVKRTVRIDQKQMVYYSEKYAKKQRADREVMIQRAEDLIRHPNKYDRVTAAGSAAYVTNIAFNKNTGEIVSGKLLSLNNEKIEAEKALDGYYSIVTSELNMSDEELRDVYRGLSRIEETFKISKSDFDSQPVFVRTNDHIDAHFTICFTALVLIRLIQSKLDNKYPIGQILESLRKYCCVPLNANIYQLTYYDKILESCSKSLSMEMNHKHRTRQQLQRLLRY